MKKNNFDTPAEKTEFGPGKTPLYYSNVGLFSDPFLEDRLPNLEKYYTHPSTQFLNSYWNIDEKDSRKFNEAFQGVMNLWNDLDQNVPKFCTKERQLQNNWIDKIFKLLGWTIELEESSSKNGITNFPDYALFASLEDWKKSKDLTGNNKFKKALAVADAKDWGISLDGKGFSNKNPSFQIVNYLKQTDKSWGILTDGKYWRIYSLRSESKHTTFYEIDLEKILATGDTERFKYFYNFFRVEAFVVDSKLSDRSFLDLVFEDGKYYSQRVEKNLNERVYKVVSSICQGFLEYYKNPSEKDLEQVYEYSMYYLFKLMFVLNCESKGLLEVNKQDDYYEYSLRKKCLEIKSQFEEGKVWSGQPATYNYISTLFKLLKDGDEKIGVHGFGKEPFEIGSLKFYTDNQINDVHLNNALLELSCDYDEDDNLQFIDYKILSSDHLGSLFEGLLEFGLHKDGRNVQLLNSKGQRKNTGSYYTPSFMVDFIVEESLKLFSSKKTTQEILACKILDPAMGSGHFLLGVTKYLENIIIEKQNNNPEEKGNINFDVIRKKVIRDCIRGVDINPLATELAKFSLWIYSSQKGDFLEPLGTHFVCGNSLLDSFNWKNIGLEKGVDCIIGNPPYLGEQGNKEVFDIVKDNVVYNNVYKRHMDYFYFFIGRGVELLKSGGSLSFITTSYWYNAESSEKLKLYLTQHGHMDMFVDFQDQIIFQGAKGQHNCMFKFLKVPGKNKEELIGTISDFKKIVLTAKVATKKRLYKGYVNIDDYFLIKQGIVTGADKVSNRNIEKIPSKFLKDVEHGDGIFILSNQELSDLKLTRDEKKIVKPLYTAKNITNDGIDAEYDKNILVTNLIKNINDYPNIKSHLEKFKTILTSRSQMEHCLDWWDLHQLRLKDKSKSGIIKDYFFDKPKIVYVSLSEKPNFQYDDGEFYCTGGGLGGIYYIYSNEFNMVATQRLANYLNSKEFLARILSGEFNIAKKGKAFNFSGEAMKKITIPFDIVEDLSRKIAS